MMKYFMDSLDNNQKNLVLIAASKEYFTVRVQNISLMVVLPAITIAVLVKGAQPGYLAILLVFLMRMANDIKRMLSVVASFENRFISFERCNYFMNIPPEDGYKHLREMKTFYVKMMNNDFKEAPLVIKPEKPDWPRTGKIEFRNFAVRYRPDLDYVLKNITFSLPSGTKLGILGRTGAGKSTLISAIFRYFSNYEGDIVIDDVKVRDLDLQELRSSLTIIPQEPILFNGTLKRNLDPSGTHSDEEIIKVLKDVKLWDKYKDHGLNFEIEASGSNLSQGEKQLICFGRAVIDSHKVILMDEATANIDLFTEKIIQTLVVEKFQNSTILMIAHKLETIMICNK